LNNALKIILLIAIIAMATFPIVAAQGGDGVLIEQTTYTVVIKIVDNGQPVNDGLIILSKAPTSFSYKQEQTTNASGITIFSGTYYTGLTYIGLTEGNYEIVVYNHGIFETIKSVYISQSQSFQIDLATNKITTPAVLTNPDLTLVNIGIVGFIIIALIGTIVLTILQVYKRKSSKNKI